MKSAVRLLAEQYRFGSITEFRTLLESLPCRSGGTQGRSQWQALERHRLHRDRRAGQVGRHADRILGLDPQRRLQVSAKADRQKRRRHQIRANRGSHSCDRGPRHAPRPDAGRVRAPAENRRHRRRFPAKRRRPYHGRDVRRSPDENRARTDSRLGKSYSANVFQELFNNPHADRASPPPKLSAPAPAPATLRQQTPQKPEATARPHVVPPAAPAAEQPPKPAPTPPRQTEKIRTEPRGLSPQPHPAAACTPRHRRKPVPCRGRPAGTTRRGRPHVAGGVRSHAPKSFTQV